MRFVAAAAVWPKQMKTDSKQESKMSVFSLWGQKKATNWEPPISFSQSSWPSCACNTSRMNPHHYITNPLHQEMNSPRAHQGRSYKPPSAA